MSKSHYTLVARLLALSVISSLLSFSPPTASGQACDRAIHEVEAAGEQVEESADLQRAERHQGSGDTIE